VSHGMITKGGPPQERPLSGSGGQKTNAQRPEAARSGPGQAKAFARQSSALESVAFGRAMGGRIKTTCAPAASPAGVQQIARERRTPSASTFVSSSRANSFVERMSGSLREGSIGRLLMPPATPPAPWPDDSPCGIWTRKPTNKPP
jgi:hypothetical protein